MPPLELSPSEQIIDEEFRSRPMLQRSQERPAPFNYNEMEQRYPVRQILPRDQRQTMSTEDAMAVEDYRTKRMAEDLDIKGAQLNQQIAQKNLEYNDEIINQATQIQSRLGAIKPGAKDFNAGIAALGMDFPLAMQNPSVREQIGRLAQTNNQLVNDKDVTLRYGQQTDDRERFYEDRQEQEILQNLAAYGPTAIKIYEENLKPDETGLITPTSRIKAFAAASQEINRQKSTQLSEKPMTPQQTQAERSRLLAQQIDILKTAEVSNPADLKGDLLIEYNDVKEQRRILGGGQPQPGVLPNRNLFPKPSTKTGS